MKLPYLITKTSPSGHDAAAARNTCCFEFKTEIVVQITPTDGKRKSMRAAALRGADISIADLPDRGRKSAHFRLADDELENLFLAVGQLVHGCLGGGCSDVQYGP